MPLFSYVDDKTCMGSFSPQRIGIYFLFREHFNKDQAYHIRIVPTTQMELLLQLLV